MKAVLDGVHRQIQEQFDISKDDLLTQLINHVKGLKDEEGDYIGVDKESE